MSTETKDQNEAAKFITIRGKTMFAHLTKPTKPNPNKPEIQPYHGTDLLIDGITVNKLQNKGVTTIKSDNPKFLQFVQEQGLEPTFNGSYVRVKKNLMKKSYVNGEVQFEKGKPVMVPADAPKILDSAENEIPYDSGILVGNGSDVELRCVITGTPGDGNVGLRLISTKIIKLVEPPRDTIEDGFVFGAQSVGDDDEAAA